MNEMRRPHSLFFPLLLVTAGVFFLLANLGIIQNTIWGIMAIYWPLIFVIGGLDGLYQHENWVGPLVGIGLGTVLGTLVQSSATTVMLVGFINAGLMTLAESVPPHAWGQSRYHDFHATDLVQDR